MLTIKENRPPYVRFETRAVEDRQASVDAGHYVGRDVAFALITPQGSKDCIEREVSDWFASAEQQVLEGRLPPEWLDAFKRSFKSWKDGQELPVEGTPIVNWPAISPAQVKMLLSIQIRSVEDLAAANEESLNRMGMGARALKQRAQSWLQSADGTGKSAEQLAALQVSNEELARKNSDLERLVKELAGKLELLAESKPLTSKKL